MTKSYRLLPRDGTATYQKIVINRKWIGRVAPIATGGYIGIINRAGGSREEVHADTAVAAFEGVVARLLGYPDADSLKASNARVRARARARKAKVRALVREFEASDFKGKTAIIDRLFDQFDKNDK